MEFFILRSELTVISSLAEITLFVIVIPLSGACIRTPALVAVENWTKFVNDAEELFAEWVALEETLELNENERIANEQARQENYSELVDTGIMQENINQKLADAEQEYAPRLTELERFNINDEQYKIKFEVVNNQPRLIYGRAD